MTVQISQRGKAYFQKARTLLRAAQPITDPAIAGQLRALIDDYQRRAEKALHVDTAKAFARSPAHSLAGAGDGTAAAVCVGLAKGGLKAAGIMATFSPRGWSQAPWHSLARRGARTRLRETEATRFTKFAAAERRSRQPSPTWLNRAITKGICQ